ncbi:hypothetical protein J6590_088224 [Homalodisca vitripennis]|nr:hypothetical protein J6590_088224 [Homalodisca vitripennis]
MIVGCSTDGPCGNTAVSKAEVAEARRLFALQLPAATSGLSIVQELAVAAASKTVAASTSTGRDPISTVHRGDIGSRPWTMSRRVVNSHLDYFRKFAPFSEGNFSKETIYGFLFFAVVENRVRMSYAKRVLRSLLSYARRHLAENGGSDRLKVVIEKPEGRSTVMDIKLTPESVAFFKENPRGTVVRSKVFYHLMNSVGEQTKNERLKNAVCEARRPRELVFSEQQNATLLSDGQSDAIDTLVSRDTAFNTPRRQVDTERTVFEFCVAFLLGFLTGARVKSTIARLTVAEIDRLIRGGTLEKFTKASFARVFVPESLVYSSNGGVDARREIGVDPREPSSVARLLYHVTVLRRNPLFYPTGHAREIDWRGNVRSVGDFVRVEDQPFFLSNGRQLDYAFERIFTKLFSQRRPKGVFWHSQRRRYLGSVNEKYGAVTASKSVGHADVATTMSYINKSMHRDDTNRRAGEAVREEIVRLMTQK